MITPQDISNNLNVVLSSLKGERGPEQVEITIAGLELLALVLRKNADYGGSALKSPVMAPGTTPQSALRCRMSDKIQRVIKLSISNPEVPCEGIDDAIDDLAGYGVLDKVLRNRLNVATEKKEANDQIRTDKELERSISNIDDRCVDRDAGKCSD